MKKFLSVFLSLSLCFCFLSRTEAKSAADITSLQQINGSGSYRLTADITADKNLEISASDAVILDLNGHTIQLQEKSIINQGSLTIQDRKATGKILTDNTILIRNNASLYIAGGSYETKTVGGAVFLNANADSYLQIDDASVEARSYAVYNKGKAIINQGTFHSSSSNTDKTASGATFFAYCIANKDLPTSSMTINNAKVTGVQGAVANATGNIIIKDGYFATEKDNPKSFYALYVAGEYNVAHGEIYGGYFYSPKYAVSVGNDNTDGDGGVNAEATTEIYGGSFYGDQGAVQYAPITGKNPYILGGTFNSDISAYLADNAIMKEADGLFTVGKKLSSITMPETLSVSVHTKRSLSPVIDPADTIETISWTSSDPSIVSVDQNGTITAHKKGSAVIKAVAASAQAQCQIQVYQLDVPGQETTSGSVSSNINDEASKNIIYQFLDQAINDPNSSLDPATKTNLQNAITAGKKITVLPAAKPLKANTINSDIKKSITKAAEKLNQKNQTIIFGEYLDISLNIEADEQPLGSIHQLPAPIKISISIPKKLIKPNRTYYIIRYHDGKADVLPTSQSSDTLTFETDRFSTYAIVYTDSPKASANTYDSTDPISWTSVMILSAITSILCVISYRSIKKFG